MTILNSDSPDRYFRFGGFLNVIIDTQLTDSKLPGRERVRAHQLAMTGLDGRLVRQLFVNRIEDDRPLASSQGTQVPHRLSRVLDLVPHGPFPLGHVRRLRAISPPRPSA